MLGRSFAAIIVITASFVLATAQVTEVKKEDPDKTGKTTGGTQVGQLRDFAFADGVSLQFLIKELARDMGLNVLFDSESRLENRKVRIELKNVTPAEALNHVVLQEGLGFREAGPRTIVVALQSRLASILQIGNGIAVLEAVSAKTTGRAPTERLRDIPFPGGVDMQFLIKELAKDMGLNVLFDSDSRLESRKMRIDLRNVTAAEALNYVVLQEGLFLEDAGPGTILVASQVLARAIPRLGVGTTLLTQQLAQYFGVEGGILINDVRAGSVGSKAGLKAGDVIVGVDDESVRGVLGLIRALDRKKDSEITLRIVREHQEQTVSLRLFNTSP